MTEISISLSGLTGVDWTRWQGLASEVEALGFAGLYRYDHFAAPYPYPLEELLCLWTHFPNFVNCQPTN